MRAFDHLVVCVADLDRARASYAALGFTLTPPATHPFGTRNSLVQLAGRNFLELLAIGDRSAIPPHVPGRFSFAAFNAAFLERCGEGASALAFATQDARADVAAFRGAGLGTYEPFDFGREAIQPDGGVAHVGFSLAFVTHLAMPDAAFFTCQHRHPPELFWKPEYQRHLNGAESIVEIEMSATDPAATRDFLERLTTETAVASDSGDLRFGPASGRLSVRRGADSPRFVSVRVAVRDLVATRDGLERRSVPHRRAGDVLVVPPDFAHGVGVEFGP